MARPLRIEYPGAWYHVMNRGAGRRGIFPDDVLRQAFLCLLRDIHQMYAVDCHAYCLMGNHYHLLLQSQLANLGRAMRHLDGVYAQRHNRHIETDGPLFRGRYKAQLIEQDSYLQSVSRYVHRNPLDAGLCNRVINYPWSSYPYYAGLRPVPPWLRLHETTATFGSEKAYCSFVEKNEEEDVEYDDLAGSLAGGTAPAVLGSPAFVDAIQRRYCESPDYEIPQAKAPISALTLDDIVCAVSAHTAISRRDIITAADARHRTVRAMAMLLCRQHGGFRLRDIAAAFGIERYTTVASAISRCRDKAARDSNLGRELAVLQQKIQKMRNA